MKHKESEVRFDAALSLLGSQRKEKCGHESCCSNLDRGLDDSEPLCERLLCRGFRKNCTPDAIKGLMPFLRTARWCSHTDNRRPF